MDILEIILTLIGIVIIVISCKMIERTDLSLNNSRIVNKQIDEQASMLELNKMNEKVKVIINESSEEAIAQAEDYMNKLSNEKIMAISEYSDQVLEKIERNHDDVVFLYNMLNDKEKELKAIVQEINSSKKKMLELIDNKTEIGPDIPSKTDLSQKTQLKLHPKSNSDKKILDIDENRNIMDDMNYNDQILDLYSKGKSVFEISKLLDLGQGEVKLVVDLFQNKK